MTSFAIAAGAMLAAAALAFVIAPLVRRGHAPAPPAGAPPPSGSNDDAAEAAIRRYRDARASCPDCGDRPEAGAVFCSSCGRYLPGRCTQCGSDVREAGASWCSTCGESLAAR
jgi:hypothetical protein